MNSLQKFPSKSWIVVAGPTASGKSALGMALARDFGGEIVGCDSVQVYKGFDIGSAKPSRSEIGEVPHHMIDVATWREEFNTGTYGSMGRQVLDEIRARGKLPIVVGGSGLYLRALFGQNWHGELPKDENLRVSLEAKNLDVLFSELQKLDPDRASEIHPNDKFRLVRALELVTLLGHPLRQLQSEQTEITSDAYVVVLDPDRTGLHEAIATRTASMLSGGLLGETKQLLDEGCPITAKPMQSIGYRQAAALISGEIKNDEVLDLILAATRQYAKRQTTWFKSVTADERLTGVPGGFTSHGYREFRSRISKVTGFPSLHSSL